MRKSRRTAARVLHCRWPHPTNGSGTTCSPCRKPWPFSGYQATAGETRSACSDSHGAFFGTGSAAPPSFRGCLHQKQAAWPPPLPVRAAPRQKAPASGHSKSSSPCSYLAFSGTVANRADISLTQFPSRNAQTTNKTLPTLPSTSYRSSSGCSSSSRISLFGSRKTRAAVLK